MATIIRDVTSAEYTVTNITADRALNCNEEAGALLVADVLGTLIKDLIEQGILKGTVS
jgi:hypothetical protein